MGRKDISIRRSMLNNMLLVVALLSAAVLAATVFGANSVAQTLSRTLLSLSINRTETRVRHFVAPVEHGLELIGHWAAEFLFDPATGDGAVELLLPYLKEYRQLSAGTLVDPRGRMIMVFRDQGGWSLRIFDPNGGSSEARVRRLQASNNADWQVEKYAIDSSARPWFVGAQSLAPGKTFWTDAYRFFQTDIPGISASQRITDNKGQQWVVAFDVLLEDISEFTRQIKIGYQGLLLITDDKGRTIGLPDVPQFASNSARERAYLKHPAVLDFPLAADASKAFQPKTDGPLELDPVRFYSDGHPWWGQAKWIPIGTQRQLFAAVIVPERVLLGALNQVRIMIVSVTFLVSLLAILRGVVLARRYSNPIHKLALQSLAMSEGILEEPKPIHSSLSEVTGLAAAHKRMRHGLANLLRLEDDLRLARQIQQKTFPQSYPVSAHYEIGAGSRPAEETGGDTFDVVGVRIGKDGVCELTNDNPDRIFLILADATGHGMGPALTASQVRAMFRMGVRLGRSVIEISRQMNDQLKADVHGGRFVTAWIGCVCAQTHTMEMYSAGQAPVLLYRRDSDSFEEIAADGPPMGVIDGIADSLPKRTGLEAGDLLVILSDGVYDAKAFDGHRFGQQRVEQIIRVNRQLPAMAIIDSIREEVDRFMGDRSADDDQTGIIIKRL